MTSTQLAPRNVADLTTEQLGHLLVDVATALTDRSHADDNDLGDVLGELNTSLGLIGRSVGMAYARTWAPGGQSRGQHLAFTMHSLREEKPAAQWKALFNATWMGYRTWYTSEGISSRPTLNACRVALQKYMPELVPTWENLVELADGDPLAARMLSMWNPPAYVSGCSQLVLEGPPRVLIRNYDYDPALFEQVVYSTRFNDRQVIGTADCLWGLLDGMNDDGLVVSLTAGGRPGSGSGFAIPLVLRYILEVCSSVADVQAALSRIPVAASYNVTVSDASGTTGTFFVAPGTEPEYFETPLATNHRGTVPEYPDLAARFNSVERQNALADLFDADAQLDRVTASFLQPPLYNTRFSQGFGTLYTVLYHPDEGIVEYVWPDGSWRREFDSPPATKEVTLYESA